MKDFIPVLLSILIALGGSYFLYEWLKKQRAPEKVVAVRETKAVSVVVSKVDLPWGTKINPETLITRPYFEESLPTGYFSNPADPRPTFFRAHVRHGVLDLNGIEVRG